MKSTDAYLYLTDVARALREIGVRTTYHQLYFGIVSGEIPGHREGRRWTIRRSDLPTIGVRLGTTAPPAA